MSKMRVVVVAMLLGLASVSFAQEPVESFAAGGMTDPYAGPTPSGMRFGDVGHVSMQTGDAEGGGYTPGTYIPGTYTWSGCPTCGFGVHGLPCDPEWSGPCVDWKTIGWYSHWHDKDHLWCEKGHGHCCRACGCRAPCSDCDCD